eukprot:10086250-Alexandrium_andersonii.AAC.1
MFSAGVPPRQSPPWRRRSHTGGTRGGFRLTEVSQSRGRAGSPPDMFGGPSRAPGRVALAATSRS